MRHGLLGHHAVARHDVQGSVDCKFLSLVGPQVRHTALVHPLVFLLNLRQAEAVGDGVALHTHSLGAKTRGNKQNVTLLQQSVLVSTHRQLNKGSCVFYDWRWRHRHQLMSGYSLLSRLRR